MKCTCRGEWSPHDFSIFINKCVRYFLCFIFLPVQSSFPNVQARYVGNRQNQTCCNGNKTITNSFVLHSDIFTGHVTGDSAPALAGVRRSAMRDSQILRFIVRTRKYLLNIGIEIIMDCWILYISWC